MLIALGCSLVVLAALMGWIARQNVQYTIMLDDLHKAQNAKCKEPTAHKPVHKVK